MFLLPPKMDLRLHSSLDHIVGLVRIKNSTRVGSKKMFRSSRQYISQYSNCILRTEEPYVERVKAVNQPY